MTTRSYRTKKTLEFSEEERSESEFLVVEPDPATRAALKAALGGLRFRRVTDASDHYQALEKARQRAISHVLFDAKESNIAADEFLTQLLETDPDVIALPVSSEPTIDDVFSLLCLGAKGYIVKPFTPESLDTALLLATKGEPISPAILYAKDRNEALASLAMTALDKVALLTVEARRHDTARYELTSARVNLQRSLDIARTFAKGGDEGLVEAMIAFCLERAMGPSSKLGRIRKRRKGVQASSPQGESDAMAVSLAEELSKSV